MGLFKKAVNKAVKSAVKSAVESTTKPKKTVKKNGAAASKQAQMPTQETQPWFPNGVNWDVESVELFGPADVKVYVYNGEPIKHIRKGESFELRPFYGDCQIRSLYTGSVFDSRKSRETVVMYGNLDSGYTIIGFAEISK